MQDRVDQVALFVLADPICEDPQSDADLRCGQARARCVDHRLGEVGDELPQLLVEHGHRLGRRAQDGVAEQANRLNGHQTSVLKATLRRSV